MKSYSLQEAAEKTVLFTSVGATSIGKHGWQSLRHHLRLAPAVQQKSWVYSALSVGLTDGCQPNLSFRPGHQQTPKLLQELHACQVKGDGYQILGGVVWKGLETQDKVRARHLMSLCTSVPAEGVRAIWKDEEGQGFLPQTCTSQGLGIPFLCSSTTRSWPISAVIFLIISYLHADLLSGQVRCKRDEGVFYDT